MGGYFPEFFPSTTDPPPILSSRQFPHDSAPATPLQQPPIAAAPQQPPPMLAGSSDHIPPNQSPVDDIFAEPLQSLLELAANSLEKDEQVRCIMFNLN